MAKLLEVKGVSKSFPGVKALDDVQFDLEAGEVLALVGENGAGKSTLMKVLTGLYKADSGEVRINGEVVHPTNAREAQELGLAIIHQELNLMPDLTVAENIFIRREPRKGPFLLKKEINNKAAALLKETGIDLNPKTIVGTLTVAEQQMVEIAKALSFPQTKLLIMDEPTSAISKAETVVLFKLIRELKAKGVGIVYISHRMEELPQIADRVTVLRDGKYIGTNKVGNITEDEIIAMMVGREIKSGMKPDPSVTNNNNEYILEANNVSTKNLLKNVTIQLKRGEILGLAGLVGAGRTEIARAIMGADPITEGTFKYKGQPIQIGNPSQAVKAGIGYLPEDRKAHGLMLEQSVHFNSAIVTLPKFINKLGFVKEAASRRISQAYVDSLKTKTPSINTMAKSLSGGNQQKVVIAKWLAQDCDVLIFDEPTRGIDVGAKEEIYNLINELVETGKSLIVISSELPEVLRLSHRIVVMANGEVAGTLNSAEADQEKIMDLAANFGKETV